MRNSIEHRVGDMFSAEKNVLSWFGHACNAQGVWGSGVAKTFKEKYEREFLIYQGFCQRHTDSRDAVGRGILAGRVVCLITSSNYGRERDDVGSILDATEVALTEALRTIGPGSILHLPKINSGIFGVEWSETESVINGVLVDFPSNEIVVWSLPPTLDERWTSVSRLKD